LIAKLSKPQEAIDRVTCAFCSIDPQTPILGSSLYIAQHGGNVFIAQRFGLSNPKENRPFAILVERVVARKPLLWQSDTRPAVLCVDRFHDPRACGQDIGIGKEDFSPVSNADAASRSRRNDEP
jgi:hypothetical protein